MHQFTGDNTCRNFANQSCLQPHNFLITKVKFKDEKQR